MSDIAFYEWHILCRNGEIFEEVADKPMTRSRCRKAFRRYQRELDRIGEAGIKNSFFAWVNTDGVVEFCYDDFDHFRKTPLQISFIDLNEEN